MKLFLRFLLSFILYLIPLLNKLKFINKNNLLFSNYIIKIDMLLLSPFYGKKVLREADKLDHKLYCILHGYRCIGTRLKLDNGILKLKK